MSFSNGCEASHEHVRASVYSQSTLTTKTMNNFTPEEIARERWKDLPGHEGKYQISDLGRIKSLDRFVSYSDGRIRYFRSIIRKLALRKDKGYGKNAIYHTCTLSNESTIHVHISVAKLFIPNPLKLPHINHIDGVGTNNRVENLEWVTPGDNQRHAYRIGLQKRKKGELHGKSKLTDEQVREILSLKGVLKLTEVAKRYGVALPSIGRIWNGKGWTHISRTAQVNSVISN